MTETWFAFRAYNEQTVYGYGTEDEADRYSDILNKGREINHYAPYPVSATEASERGLDDSSEAINLGDELIARAAEGQPEA